MPNFHSQILQVIRCWDEGVAQMSVGEQVSMWLSMQILSRFVQATLECSPDYAYGEEVRFRQAISCFLMESATFRVQGASFPQMLFSSLMWNF